MTPAKELQLEFWSAFRDYVQTHGATFKPTKPLPQHWMNISIGRSGSKLNAIASLWDSESESYDKHELRAELEMNDDNAKAYYGQLWAMKQQIEDKLEKALTWYNPDNKRVCRMYFRTTVDLYDREQWQKYSESRKGEEKEGRHTGFFSSFSSQEPAGADSGHGKWRRSGQGEAGQRAMTRGRRGRALMSTSASTNVRVLTTVTPQ